jgi:sodium-dependent phosphate cotransporter
MTANPSVAAARPERLEQDGLAAEARTTARGPAWRGWLGALAAVVAVYFFIAAINVMGHGLKTVATVPASKAIMDQVYHLADNPLAGLCVGVLLTSLVQSSSFTTTFTVGVVAAGQIPFATAIFIIMGANIGTSVTNTLVSLAHLRRRAEFRRSLAGATVHDFFNVLNVCLLMPLEWGFGIISRPASAFGHWLEGAAFFTASPKKYNVVKMAVKPITRASDWLFGTVFGLEPTPRGLITAVVGVALLFAALLLLVKVLRDLMRDRLAGLFSRTLFANQGVSFTVGIVTTVAVQSSSVTTSLIIPLVGAGVLKIKQIFPYTLGANIGTTVTAILGGLAIAAMAAGASPEVQTAAAFALAVAFAHLLFNIYGTLVFWPLQWIPISLAKGFAKVASKRRALAAVYIFVVFFLVPALVIVAINAAAILRMFSS